MSDVWDGYARVRRALSDGFKYAKPILVLCGRKALGPEYRIWWIGNPVHCVDDLGFDNVWQYLAEED